MCNRHLYQQIQCVINYNNIYILFVWCKTHRCPVVQSELHQHSGSVSPFSSGSVNHRNNYHINRIVISMWWINLNHFSMKLLNITHLTLQRSNTNVLFVQFFLLLFDSFHKFINSLILCLQLQLKTIYKIKDVECEGLLNTPE